MPRVWEVPVHDSTRVRDARVAAEAAAARAGLDEGRAAGAALVATELATNLLKHAGGGLILLDVMARPAPDRADGAASLVQIVAIDHGPGMPDVASALRDGFSTTSSLGAGLGTCRRVSDDFDLHSTVGLGTVALARIGARPGRRRAPDRFPAPAVRAGGVNIPFAGAEFSGDAWAWVRTGDLTTLMLADGLGHGLAAARASSAAVEQLCRAPELPPRSCCGGWRARCATPGARPSPWPNSTCPPGGCCSPASATSGRGCAPAPTGSRCCHGPA